MNPAARKPADVLDSFGLAGYQRTRAARGLARDLIHLERKQAVLLARYPSASDVHRQMESMIGQISQQLRNLARPVVAEEGA
jgi:hypothetical protein